MEKMIIDKLMSDNTSNYYSSLIEMQSKTSSVLDGLNKEPVKNIEKSKAKKLTKSYIRGRINKY